jgi:hypothetical protein
MATLCALRTLATAGVVLVALGGVARAEPQSSVALTIGVAGVGEQRAYWDETVLHLGAHADFLFGRSKPTDFALGPFLELGTLGFNDFQFAGGASGLLPIFETFPLVVSLGGYGRATGTWGVEPGLVGQLFWGSRSYNYHSIYGMSAGLVGQLRFGLGSAKDTAIIVGAQLDLAAMSLPFIYLYKVLAGPSREAAPVETKP